jgi:hypothetical protein
MESPLFQAQVLFDFCDQPFADFLLSVHRENRGTLGAPNLEMAPFAGRE